MSAEQMKTSGIQWKITSNRKEKVSKKKEKYQKIKSNTKVRV